MFECPQQPYEILYKIYEDLVYNSTQLNKYYMNSHNNSQIIDNTPPNILTLCLRRGLRHGAEQGIEHWVRSSTSGDFLSAII